MTGRRWPLLALAALPVLAAGVEAAAQNSLGLGNPEPAIAPSGPFGAALAWIKNQQAWFYELMRAELRSLRAGGPGVLALTGLSFAYGVFHAAGPGHGKAVISAYMIANEVEARRGIALAFASAFAQALTAILLVGALTLALRGLGWRQQDMAAWLETASYASIMALGAWLLWTKIARRGHAHGHGHARGHDHRNHPHGHSHDPAHPPGHDEQESCGHLHAPDPKALRGPMGIAEARSAILAVGLRPCSGALIVLTFAFLNGLFLAGFASVGAMAVGTGLTVAALALVAVKAKDVAVRLAGTTGRAAGLHRAIEIAGAAAVFLLGFFLLTANLSA